MGIWSPRWVWTFLSGIIWNYLDIASGCQWSLIVWMFLVIYGHLMSSPLESPLESPDPAAAPGLGFGFALRPGGRRAIAVARTPQAPKGGAAGQATAARAWIPGMG